MKPISSIFCLLFSHAMAQIVDPPTGGGVVVPTPQLPGVTSPVVAPPAPVITAAPPTTIATTRCVCPVYSCYKDPDGSVSKIATY